MKREERQALVDVLLACPSINDRKRRDNIIDELSNDIKHNIKRSDVDRDEVANLVKACLNYPDGLQELTEVIVSFEGATSIPLQAVKQLVASQPSPPQTQTQPPSGDNFDMSSDFRNATINIKSTITGQQGGVPLQRPARHPQFRHQLSIFVASPGDVRDERERVHRIVEEMNQPDALADQYGLTLQVLDWRNAIPGAGQPEAVILDQLQLESWDIFIGVLWHRFGSPTGGQDPTTGRFYDSGTEEEFRLAFRAWQETGRPHILTYRRTVAPVALSDIDPEQLTKVQYFWEEFGPDGQHPDLFQQYETPDNFERRVRGDLIKLLAKLK